MSNVAIKVEGLGKKYLIKHEKKESYQTFQDMLLRAGKQLITPPFFRRGNEGVGALNPLNKNTHKNDNSIEEFWALDDINFESNKGVKLCFHLKN